MTTRKVAVIGGGVAGVSAALAASRLGAKTTLIDSSKRVGLSKALMPFLISDGWTEDDLVLPEAKALAGAGVDTHTGERVTSVQRGGDKIRVESSSRRGTSAGFDSVVICTGAASEAPQLRGLSKPNVFVLGEPADYLKFSGGLDAFQTVVVSGPIPLALKLGEILANKGKRVQVYCGKGGLERQFSDPVAAAIRRRVSSGESAERVLLIDGPVDSILGVARAEAVVSSGSVLTCDAVVRPPWKRPLLPLGRLPEGARRGSAGRLLDVDEPARRLRRRRLRGDQVQVRLGPRAPLLDEPDGRGGGGDQRGWRQGIRRPVVGGRADVFRAGALLRRAERGRGRGHGARRRDGDLHLHDSPLQGRRGARHPCLHGLRRGD